MQWHQCATFVAVITFSLIPNNVIAFSSLSSRVSRLTWTNYKVSNSPTSLSAYPPRKNSGTSDGTRDNDKNDDNDDDEFDALMEDPAARRGDSRNWIEESPSKVSSTDDSTTSSSSATDDTEKFDLGIDGESFQTGQLSKRMYDALLSAALKRFPDGTTVLPTELEDVYKTYAMDITAKEAVKAALQQNGFDFINLFGDDGAMQDIGEWGAVESVQILNVETTGEVNNSDEASYTTLQLAVEKGGWIPGETFNFVVRNVPAKLKDMDVSELLNALDPDGSFRVEAKEKGMTLPDEEITSLRELGNDSERRSNVTPRETDTDNTVYKGDGSKGYNIMQRSDLICKNADGSVKEETMMHVMDAFVNHGCLIVDLTDNGTSYQDAIKMSQMWQTTDSFFKSINEVEGIIESLPKIGIAEGAGSPNAVVGFASYGSMQFLETRTQRNEGGISGIMPKEVEEIIEKDGVSAMIDSFGTISSVGKDVVRIAVTAASIEYEAFLDDRGDTSPEMIEGSSDMPLISGLTFEEAELTGVVSNDDVVLQAEKNASRAAALMVDELIDDGTSRASNAEQGSVNMTPHRLCRYTSTDEGSKSIVSKFKETFGAHADTSFVTIIPVAGVSGLEVFDEAADCWFRPELLARKAWEMSQKKLGLNPDAQTEEVVNVGDDGKDYHVHIPWHSRYLVIMPGELLQICSRNEIPAAVHRVVTVTNGSSRLSAPVLLPPRTGMQMDINRYFGQPEVAGPLLSSCEGMKMEEIHDGLQPSSYKN